MPTKMFNTKAECDRFERDMPPCRSIKRKHTATLAVTLTWEPLCLARNPSKNYPVIRETEHAYIIRDDTGLMLKVNRYTLMAGLGDRFQVV